MFVRPFSSFYFRNVETHVARKERELFVWCGYHVKPSCVAKPTPFEVTVTGVKIPQCPFTFVALDSASVGRRTTAAPAGKFQVTPPPERTANELLTLNPTRATPARETKFALPV